MNLSTPVAELPKVGKVTSTALSRLGILTIKDLIYHIPVSYEDYREVFHVNTAPIGLNVTLMGKIIRINSRKSFKKRGLAVTEGIFQDDTGALPIIWFHRYLFSGVPLDDLVYLVGQINMYRGRQQFVNPLWERVTKKPRYATRLVPHYSLSRSLTQWRVRSLVDQSLKYVGAVNDWATKDFLVKHNLITINKALKNIHKPSTDKEIIEAKRRLAFDELFFLQLSRRLAQMRRRLLPAPKISIDPKIANSLVKNLPFSLTTDQNKVITTILADFKKGYPMQRLLQGEVGSGKTAVAAVASANIVSAGYQVLYLAPTEILAEQQYQMLQKLFSSLGIIMGLLTRSRAQTTTGLTNRSSILKAIKNKEVDIVVGTHAVLRANVESPHLGFVVVDEQHRFGVADRLAIQDKSVLATPHLLSMTATPIPRTLQLAFCGDLDISTLRSLPHGRRLVKTAIVESRKRSEVERRLRFRIANGELAYVVCPVIDPSDRLQVRAASEEYERLSQQVFPEFKVGYLHGRMKASEKEKTLQAFRQGKLNILVATSVVEVGLDIEKASIIIIEGADRFGVAQLHQLRGRVGRRGNEGYCLLFTENPSERSLNRLRTFALTQDGFKLAEEDLKLRGPGEWFGVEQSGFPEFKVADLNDVSLLNEVSLAVEEIINEDSELKNFPVLRRRMETALKKMIRPS